MIKILSTFLKSLLCKALNINFIVGLITVQSAAYEAVIISNEGHAGRLDVMRQLDILPGVYAKAAAKKADEKRIMSAQKKTQAASKESRTTRRMAVADEQRKEEAAGASYASGGY